MSDTKLWTIAELNAHVDGRLIGDGSIHVERVADIASAATGEISYVEDEKFFGAARASKTSCLIAPPEFVASVKDLIVEQEFRPALIEVSKPKLAFALVAGLLHPQKHREPFVHASAVIAETADVDLTVFIGAHVAIGEGARLGASSRRDALRQRNHWRSRHSTFRGRSRRGWVWLCARRSGLSQVSAAGNRVDRR